MNNKIPQEKKKKCIDNNYYILYRADKKGKEFVCAGGSADTIISFLDGRKQWLSNPDNEARFNRIRKVLE